MKVYDSFLEFQQDVRILILRERPDLTSIIKYVNEGIRATLYANYQANNGLIVRMFNGDIFNSHNCEISKASPKTIFGMVLPTCPEKTPTGYKFQVRMSDHD